VTLRHHRIVETLAELARSVGYVVTREPHFALAAHTEKNEITGELSHTVSPNHKRGDLLIIRHNSRLLVDVTVARPTGQTEMRRQDSSASHATTSAAEKRKHRKYDASCAREGLQMVPFALESYGSKGKEAHGLLLKLAESSHELSATAFMRHASAAISFALQCGNADIAARGTQSLRTHQATLQSVFANATVTTAGRNKLKRHLQNELKSPVDINFHTHWHAATATAPLGAAAAA